MEHPRDDGATPEQRNTEQRNAEQQRNSRNTTEQGRNTGIIPQKLQPEDKHDIFLSGGIRVRILRKLDVVNS